MAALCVQDSQTSDARLRTEVLKALTVLVKNVPKQMATWLQQILPLVWSTLTTIAEKYVREVVNEGGEDDDVVVTEKFLVSRILYSHISSLSTPWWRLTSSKASESGSVRAGVLYCVIHANNGGVVPEVE